jgi:hypothetical protein
VLIGFRDEYFGELAAQLQHSRSLIHNKVRYWKPSLKQMWTSPLALELIADGVAKTTV